MGHCLIFGTEKRSNYSVHTVIARDGLQVWSDNLLHYKASVSQCACLCLDDAEMAQGEASSCISLSVSINLDGNCPFSQPAPTGAKKDQDCNQ